MDKKKKKYKKKSSFNDKLQLLIPMANKVSVKMEQFE